MFFEFYCIGILCCWRVVYTRQRLNLMMMRNRDKSILTKHAFHPLYRERERVVVGFADELITVGVHITHTHKC